MTNAETRYAQIKKEAPALTWHVRSSPQTYWAWQSSWRPTSNHLCLYWATPTLTTYHLEHYASVSSWCNSATPSVTSQGSYFMLCWCSASMSHQAHSEYHHSGDSGVSHHSHRYATAGEEHLKVYCSTQMQDPLCSRVLVHQDRMGEQAAGTARAEAILGGTWTPHWACRDVVCEPLPQFDSQESPTTWWNMCDSAHNAAVPSPS